MPKSIKSKVLNFSAVLLLASAALAGGKTGEKAPAGPAERPAAKVPYAVERPVAGLTQRKIKTGDIEVYAGVTGIPTAQDTYDVLANSDGRIEEVQAEIFSFVTPKTVLATMVSSEMAALLDASTEDSRKQTESRWQDLYKLFDIKPEAEGVITNIYVEPKTTVSKGDRLFTVAKKVVIIGKNTEPLYSDPAPGMTAEMEHVRNPDEKFETRLISFVKYKNDPRFSRLWLEVTDLKDGIKIGEQFNGTLFVGKSSNTMLVPRGDLVEAGGRRFLIVEVETGLETGREVEILRHTSRYLEPEYPGEKNGKDQKVR